MELTIRSSSSLIQSAHQIEFVCLEKYKRTYTYIDLSGDLKSLLMVMAMMMVMTVMTMMMTIIMLQKHHKILKHI